MAVTVVEPAIIDAVTTTNRGGSVFRYSVSVSISGFPTG